MAVARALPADHDHSDVLSEAEIMALPDSTVVEVIWSGGNGPHHYEMATDKYGNRFIASSYLTRQREVRVWIDYVDVPGGARFSDMPRDDPRFRKHVRVWGSLRRCTLT